MLANVPSTFNPHQAALLAHALAYASRGWSVIPTVGKKAAVKWKRCQAEQPDPDIIAGMFRRPDVTGLAVITGRGLAVRDFDNADAYQAWAEADPDDARRLPTVRTARGYHVLGQLTKERFTAYGDGELRASSRHYVVLPPSRHPSGSIYTWLNPLPDGALPELPESLCRGWVEKTQANTGPHTACVANADLAIAATLPTGPGQRNRCLFRLARQLKAIMPNADFDRLSPLIREWHRQALPFIRTKDFGTTWSDFVLAWGNVKHPVGQSFREATAGATGIVLRGAASQYDGPLLLLAQHCAALQRFHGPDKAWPYLFSASVQ